MLGFEDKPRLPQSHPLFISTILDYNISLYVNCEYLGLVSSEANKSVSILYRMVGGLSRIQQHLANGNPLFDQAMSLCCLV